jgi:hypothetical protein
VVSIYTLVRYLDTRSIRWAAAHAVACGLLVDIRIVGLMVPVFTLGFAAAGLLARGSRFAKRDLLGLAVFFPVLAGVIVLAWPTLWHRPVYHLIQAFKEMSHYPLEVRVMYMGAYSLAKDLPWHYTPVWIAITTPLLYSAGFLAGCLALLGLPLARLRKRGPGRPSLRLGAGTGRRSVSGTEGKIAGRAVRDLPDEPPGRLPGSPISGRDSAILLVWFFFPLLYVTLSGATLFDGWRHTYFTYPAFLGIALAGFTWALRALRTALRSSVSRIATAVAVAAVAVGLLNIARIMIKYHPYEHLYFNALTGGVRGAEGKYDLDYWGLSYRQALEHIVKIDRSPAVKVGTYARPGRVNAEILAPDDRKRLVFEANPYDATYYVTDLRWDKFQYPREDIVREIFVDGARIMVVVRVVNVPR